MSQHLQSSKVPAFRDLVQRLLSYRVGQELPVSKDSDERHRVIRLSDLGYLCVALNHRKGLPGRQRVLTHIDVDALKKLYAYLRDTPKAKRIALPSVSELAPSPELRTESTVMNPLRIRDASVTMYYDEILEHLGRLIQLDEPKQSLAEYIAQARMLAPFAE